MLSFGYPVMLSTSAAMVFLHQRGSAMDIGIGSYTFPWSIGRGTNLPALPMPPLRLIEKAVELEISLVQICDNRPLDRLTEAELAHFARYARERGVRIEVGARGIASNHLRRYLQLAVFFHSPMVRIVTDTADHHPGIDEIVTRISSVMGDYEAAGISLALENHDRFTAREYAEIVTRVGSPQLGICLDTVNSFGALEGPEIVLQTLAPWVISLHVKDFTVVRAPHQLGFLIEGRPAGQGRLNLPRMLQVLAVAGRTPNAVLELWTPPEATLAETIVKEERWARESLAYLHTVIQDS
jgi:sugar phosphate isomerase/epimerase